MNEKQIVEALEIYIDSHSVAEALIALSIVCMDKSAHLQENWQDNRSAKAWRDASNYLDKAAHAKSIEAIS